MTLEWLKVTSRCAKRDEKLPNLVRHHRKATADCSRCRRVVAVLLEGGGESARILAV